MYLLSNTSQLMIETVTVDSENKNKVQRQAVRAK
jgi:hypothetical protein